MGRAPCCEKVGLKKGRWTAEEDEILIKFIQANGEGSWRSLPKNAGTIINNIILKYIFLFFLSHIIYILFSFWNDIKYYLSM